MHSVVVRNKLLYSKSDSLLVFELSQKINASFPVFSFQAILNAFNFAISKKKLLFLKILKRI